MVIRLGRLCGSMVFNYRGHDRRGLNRFANGYGLRIGNVVGRVWRLGDNDYSLSRLSK
jgi:hypothetical protein